MHDQLPPKGWYPAPNGDPILWFWDGSKWIDPTVAIGEKITELLIPHLEQMFADGFKAGVASMTGDVRGLSPAMRSVMTKL
ncbi:hypothetical protein KIY76_gp80 [Mycobacterium phage Miramae]|uniref:DUF2510 domain-containing protein n=1 Tax=Mycobacterium phage Miramae TaxID=2517961 RepID=A0A482JCV5_9CAUD|nr:hypothetical protein KIY76_gp80 [Mycobacterium phage Miramae]QBP31463.1 hypothetical protein SEA_MIRAMAE_80 [Mycobacterium phage Miramae]